MTLKKKNLWRKERGVTKYLDQQSWEWETESSLPSEHVQAWAQEAENSSDWTSSPPSSASPRSDRSSASLHALRGPPTTAEASPHATSYSGAEAPSDSPPRASRPRRAASATAREGNAPRCTGGARRGSRRRGRSRSRSAEGRRSWAWTWRGRLCAGERSGCTPCVGWSEIRTHGRWWMRRGRAGRSPPLISSLSSTAVAELIPVATVAQEEIGTSFPCGGSSPSVR